MRFKRFVLLPSFETNCYLLWDEESNETILIDPAAPSEEVKKYISSNELKVKYIVNTHGHGDHIGGNAYFKESYPESKLCIHKEDSVMLSKSHLNLSCLFEEETVSPEADILLVDNMTIYLGKKAIKVFHTPGHTKGGICLFTDKYLFSGDTLFFEDIGRTDLPGGNYNDLITSVNKKLMILPDETIVLPGHAGQTTIRYEKQYNPYVTRD